MQNHLLTPAQNRFPFLHFNHLKDHQPLKKSILCFFAVFLTGLLYGQTYDSGSGTFVVPANVTHVNAAAWGGGGGGGGSNNSNRGGNGGGGGSAASSQIAVSAGNNFSYSVGTAGAAGAANAGTGGNGGTSTITSPSPITSLTGNGGTGGLGNAAGLNTPTNSGGGAATGGTNSAGANGTVGGGTGGDGGNSGTAFGLLGIGGAGSANSAGLPGLSPGAGGGGGERFFTNRPGGAGAPGRVMFDFIIVDGITPSPVCIGSTITITGNNFTAGLTTVTVNGTACSSVTVVNSTTITAVIEAGTTSGRVDVVNDGKRNNGIIISVNPAPVTPGNPTSNSPQCTPPGVTLTRTGTPPAGETWYWQTAAGNTDMTNSGATYNVTASGTYYIRARNNSTGCWSVGAGSLAITINPTISAVATTPVPANIATGICYQGFNSVSSVSWSAVAGATSYDVYFGAGSLPGTITSNVTGTAFNTGVLAANTTYFWRIVPRNSCGITTGSPATWRFTTGAAICTATYCSPTTETPTNSYITDVRFLGTLNDVQNNSNGYSGGYQNFTGLPNKTKQAAGEGINVFVKSNDVDVAYRAWVDWNKDGTFTNSGAELVYTSGGTRAISTTFGIVIPAGTAPGDYVIRTRVYRYSCASSSGYCSAAFDACGNFTDINYGEAEDYVITVVANCAANLATLPNAIYCGPSALTLTGKGTAGTTTLRWYDSLTGGNLLAETPVDGSLNASYTTPIISSTTTYYVTAFNGTCESIFRRPVVARIRPIPNISFDLPLANANFCGDDNTLKLISVGEQEQIILLEENFDSGLGLFTRSTGTNADFTSTTDTSGTFPISGIDNSTVALTGWQNQSSTFPPVGAIWKPAISSGFGGNKFAFATSDYSTTRVHTILTSTASFDTSGFTNLNLTFSAYYSYYGDTSISAGGTVEGLFVEVSTNGGSTWTTVQPYFASLGIGTAFQNMTVPLNAYLGIANLKVRFRYLAYWGDGVAIDNIKLYGDKPLSTSFVWTAPNIGIYNADCSTNYINGTPTNSVCLRPTQTQLETIASWNISALATLTNGCTTTGVITVQNNNKVWDTVATNWATTNWQPTTSIPDITKCVLIKQPVTVLSGTNGLAKVVKIEAPSGKLTINGDGSLTIQNGIINNAGIDKVVLESDSNLKQINDNPTPANSGSITARRNIKFRSSTTRDEYNYLISPVTGQSLKTLYPGVPTTSTYPYILYHSEASNFFYNSSGAYIPGRGLAVKEPSVAHVPADNKDAEFKGPLANGVITYPLAFTNSSLGYNLVGNPYASNIDLKALYTLNSANISSTFYFWDNGANNVYVQEGSNYKGRAYAVYNAVSDMGNEAGFILPTSTIIGSKKPNNIAKVAQGFMVKTNSGGKTLTFNNSVRTVDNTGVKFFSKGSASEANRYWLQLISPTNAVNTIGVVYFEEGSTAYGMDDSELNVSSSDMFYSLAEDHQLQIEGRPKFVNTDKIVLGSNYFATGNYTIALAENEGVFANGQNIYLKDKQTGIVTNLSQGAYTFAATAGASTGRFEIVYLPEAVLATDGTTKENLVVYKDGNNFVVKAQSKKITDLELFDAAGRLMRSFRPNSFKTIIPADQLLNGVYILKINQNGEITTKKVIR